jgi:hypothetical protein
MPTTKTKTKKSSRAGVPGRASKRSPTAPLCVFCERPKDAPSEGNAWASMWGVMSANSGRMLCGACVVSALQSMFSEASRLLADEGNRRRAASAQEIR